MSNLSLKQMLAAVVAVVGVILIIIFRFGFGAQQPILDNGQQPQEVTQQQTNNPEEIQVVSTNPKNLDGATILPNQSIEITFNRALENEPETKRQWDPEDTDVKTELSTDRKTVKFTPNKPFILGQGYTLTIKPDTKFDGKKTLGKDLIYHFKTISYSGV
jgi:hypothetical protein